MGCKQTKIVDDDDSLRAVSIKQCIKSPPPNVPVTLNNNNNIKRDKHVRRNKHRKISSTESDPGGSVDAKVSAKYVVKAVIAKGRFSRVLRVEHRTSKQPYAIKVVETPRDTEPSSSWDTELAVLCRVRHPNVVRLNEAFTAGRRVYMVMELATGGNLLDRMEIQGTFRESDAARVLAMVCSGLSHLHGLGIAHRDLRPENLLYSHPGADSKIMIADFGFASTPRSGKNAYMHTACGCLHYLAPEMAARRPYTSAVDMWAVGVIAFFLLAEEFPFDADQDAVMLKLILKAHYFMPEKVWSKVSRNAKSFVRSLLHRDPMKRLTALQALAHPWLSGRDSSTRGSTRQTLSLRLGRNDSSGSASTGNSYRSAASSMRSRRSVRSLVAGQRRVLETQLDVLHQDPEVVGLVGPIAAQQNGSV